MITTNANQLTLDKKREHNNNTGLKIVSNVKISAGKVPSRPMSSGANRFHPITKELFNATAPIKFIKVNLDDQTIKDNALGTG